MPGLFLHITFIEIKNHAYEYNPKSRGEMYTLKIYCPNEMKYRLSPEGFPINNAKENSQFILKSHFYIHNDYTFT